jgi:hypothetical protein
MLRAKGFDESVAGISALIRRNENRVSILYNGEENFCESFISDFCFREMVELLEAG